jgi:5-methylcytosine-specific restriction endonuclease McrA
MNRKLPWMQFFPADYILDTQPLSLQARGAWMDIICILWRAEQRGSLTHSPAIWSRILRCSEAEFTTVISELKSFKVADINIINNDVTVSCRRMLREEKDRSLNCTRQRRLRENGGGDPLRWTAIRVKILERDNYICGYCGKKARTVDHIHPKSKGGTEDESNLIACCKSCNQIKNNRSLNECGFSIKHNTLLLNESFGHNALNNSYITSYKSEVISHKSELNKENTVASAKPVEFEIFWKEYPRKIGKKKAIKAWTAAKDKPALADILKSVQVAKLTEQWKKDSGKYIPHPSTWLNEGRWDDEVKGGTVIDWDKFRTAHKEQA